MTILVIHNEYMIAGGEDAVVKSQCSYLRQAGHEVILYQRNNREINEYNLLKRAFFFLKDIFWSRRSYDEISALIKKHKPEVAHFHNVFFVITPSAYQACYDLGVPVLQQVHNYRFLCPVGTFYRQGKVCHECTSHGLWSCVKHRCYRQSTILSGIIALVVYRLQQLGQNISFWLVSSQFSKQQLEILQIDPLKVSLLTPKLEKDPGPCFEKEDFALFVGGLHDYKGIDVLIEAWRKLDKDFPLIIIGEGPLRSLVESSKSSNIQCLGALEHEKTLEYVRRARFIVFPSTCYETFGLVLLEAMASATAIVASDLGPRAEIVKEGINGLLFKNADSNDLKAKILQLINDKQLALQLGKQGRQIYGQKYFQQDSIRNLISIYLKIKL